MVLQFICLMKAQIYRPPRYGNHQIARDEDITPSR
jgi:hypothetical protein